MGFAPRDLQAMRERAHPRLSWCRHMDRVASSVNPLLGFCILSALRLIRWDTHIGSSKRYNYNHRPACKLVTRGSIRTTICSLTSFISLFLSGIRRSQQIIASWYHLCNGHDRIRSPDVMARRGRLVSNTDQLAHLPPEALLVTSKSLLVRIDNRRLPDQIGLGSRDPLGLADKLPSNVEQRRNTDQGVRGEESGDVPLTRQEDGVATEKQHDEVEDERNVGAVRLEPAVVGQALAVEALDLGGLVEGEVGDADDDVVDDLAGTEDVDEPVQDLYGGLGDAEEAEQGEAQGDDERPDWHAGLGGLCEDLGGFAVQGQAVEGARAAVGVGVASGEDAGQEEGVGDVREPADAKVVHGGDVGRGSGGSGAGGGEQARVIVLDDNADTEGGADEEDEESVEGGLEGGLKVFAGELGLTSDHGDVLGAANGEEGDEQSTEEALEVAQRASGEVVRVEGARVGPVPESVGVVLGVASAHGHECEHKDDAEKDQLASGQPELRLSVVLDSSNVDESVHELAGVASLKIADTHAYSTMQTETTAAAGMSSRQNDRTRLRAEISKGTRIAS